MDRLGELLAPYRGWDPRGEGTQRVGGRGRHAKPIATEASGEGAAATYIRAGRRRAVALPETDLAPTGDQVV